MAPTGTATGSPAPGINHPRADGRSYPQQWEADVVASEGASCTCARFCPAMPQRCSRSTNSSPNARYLRFFGPYPRIPPRDLARITTTNIRSFAPLPPSIADRDGGRGGTGTPALCPSIRRRRLPGVSTEETR